MWCTCENVGNSACKNSKFHLAPRRLASNSQRCFRCSFYSPQQCCQQWEPRHSSSQFQCGKTSGLICDCFAVLYPLFLSVARCRPTPRRASQNITRWEFISSGIGKWFWIVIFMCKVSVRGHDGSGNEISIVCSKSGVELCLQSLPNNARAKWCDLFCEICLIKLALGCLTWVLIRFKSSIPVLRWNRPHLGKKYENWWLWIDVQLKLSQN